MAHPSIRVRLQDHGIADILKAAPAKAPRAISKGINKAARTVSARFRRELVKTLGLGTAASGQGKRTGFVSRALRSRSSKPSTLRYSLIAFGGPIPLKFFKARETRNGVSAAPMNQRQVFPGTFIKGGRFPTRVAIRSGNGHVFKRRGRGRLPIERQHGPTVAEAFPQPNPAAAWRNESAARVVPAILAELQGLLR